MRMAGRLAVSFSFRKRNGQSKDIRIPENANGTCMQSTDDISIAKTARAHQIAARVIFFRVFVLV